MSSDVPSSEYRVDGVKDTTEERRFGAVGAQVQVTSVELGATRGDTQSLPVRHDDVVAVELDDGFRLWLRGDALREELAEETRDGALRLPTALGTPADGDRGLGAWVLKGIKVFGFDPIAGLVETTAEALEPAAGNQLLKLLPDTARSGLTDADAWTPVDGELPPTPDDRPILVFIHGTFSSTGGSFGELFRAPGPLASLRTGYPDRIYAFEHRTLTESPIANARDLARRLPTNARVHLVSHSRGGLVGDLLCLAPLLEQSGLLAGEYLNRFTSADQEALRGLIEVLGTRHPRVERFVRVASPSRGTTLASGRLDRWLSVVAHLLGRLPIPAAGFAELLTDFVLAVVRAPRDGETLPGLAAMMPDAPLVGLLNRPDLQLPSGTLAVIAGDIQPDGLWRRLKLLLPDLFFAGDHDLVVNTGSMYGGLRRAQGWYCFDQGAEVNHFSYFGSAGPAGSKRRPITVEALLSGLLGELPGRLYQPLAEAPTIAPARGAGSLSGRRPVLFVLPGIMGSSLAVRDPNDEVWLSIRRLALGQLQRLRMDQPLPIRPTGLLGLAYGDLLDFMGATHDVLPFAYDWRRSVRDAAALLADEVARALDRTEAGQQPVRLLAHSMGGLVARAMIAERPDLWQRMRTRGGRLVMLGTPNRGSWEIVRLLVAQASTLKQIALLDVTQNRSDLLAIIRDFPGVLELLPEDQRDFFAAAIWRTLSAHDQANEWDVPGQGQPAGASAPNWLQQAREARAWLRDQAVDPAGMVYVAGQAAETASDLEPAPGGWPRRGRGRLRFFVSRRGDGSVLWDDGVLPGVPTWYAHGVGHGDLAKERTLFGAVLDLLERGRTGSGALRPDEPVGRGADERRALEEREPAYYPDEDLLIRTALCIGPPRPRLAARPGVRVAVTHGNLAFARRRVAVGHYQGDTIIAAEAYLDHVLGGRLSARHALGLYPGPIGSHALFDHPHRNGHPPGALVVGLGRVGDLTPSNLTMSFARGLLELARELVEGPAADNAAAPVEIAITSLLIGTGAGGIDVPESMLALLRGVLEANETLAQAGQADRVRVAAIEFIELWEDLAVAAARALRRVGQAPHLAGAFDVEPLVRQGTGGNRGRRVTEDDPAWWHRLQVRSEGAGALRFTQLTQRARAEETLSPIQTVLVDRFVARASAGTGSGPELHRTLFEMLLPNHLKDGGVLRHNLVLVLDEGAARFPWEMLEDRWPQPLTGEQASVGGGRRPGAVAYGMVRQLVTEEHRVQPVTTPERRALVIGDPQSDFVPLPGARDEAERVARHLEQNGYQVRALIEPRDEDVMLALHADAYRILHLAGHGVHRCPLSTAAAQCGTCDQPLPVREQDLVSGMVIGEGMVLTPADVGKMRRVPDLVFLNCCHLARVEGKDSDRRQAYRLAANLAVAFVRMGVRVVIAAGWAVNDQAALTFAETFYRHISAGRRFGEAVRLAREQTWLQYPTLNTWGAYQCYGDPDFSLGDGGARGSKAPMPQFVCPAEAVAALDNLRADALTAIPERLVGLREALQRIEQVLERIRERDGADWRARGDVSEALGLAQGELGRFGDAVASLDRAVLAEDAGASCNAIEQRARFQARSAKALHDSGEPERAQALFDQALAALDGLQRDPTGRLTVERYRSLTGIHWRRVQCLAPRARAAELERLIAVMDQAESDLAGGQGDPLDAYSRLLWLTCKLFLTAYSARQLDEVCPRFDAWCEEIEARAPRHEREHAGAPASAVAVQTRLLAHLAQETLTDAAADAGIAALHRILMRGASQRELTSLRDYLELLHTLAVGATHKPKTFQAEAAALGRVVTALRDWDARLGDI